MFRVFEATRFLAAFLPWVLGLLAFAALAMQRVRRRPHDAPRRVALLQAWLFLYLWTAVGTELLSAFGVLHGAAILTWWLAPLVPLAAWIVRRRSRLRGLWFSPEPLPPGTWGLVLCCGGLVLCAFAVGLLAPPNNADVTMYHLPRQMFWLQQASVAHYPTYSLHQLAMPPLAEYLCMHMWALGGTDRLLFLPQWFAYIVTPLTATLIVRELGGGARRQVFAAFLVCTIPTAFYWATNEKNDLVLAVSFCALAWLAVRWAKGTQDDMLPAAILTGLLLAVITLTKATGTLCAIPFCVWIGITMIRRLGARALALGALIGVLTVSINIPHWTRNLRAFGSPVFKEQREGVSVRRQSFTPVRIAVGTAMHLALHYGTTDHDTNKAVGRWMDRQCERMGIDLDDGSMHGMYSGPYQPQHPWQHEDLSGAPVHLALMVPALFWAWRRRAEPGGSIAFHYMLVCWLAFLVFPVTLKADNYFARLHMIVLCVAAPGIAVLIRGPRWRWFGPLLAAGLLFLVIQGIRFQAKRPLQSTEGRPGLLAADEAYFRFIRNPHLRLPLFTALDTLDAESVERVGIDVHRLLTPYPVLREIRRRFGNAVTVLDEGTGLRIDGLPETPAPHRILVEAPAETAIRSRSGAAFRVDRSAWPFLVYAPAVGPVDPAIIEAMPLFVGWRSSTGLLGGGGPYPSIPAPAGRFAGYPSTELDFTNVGGAAALEACLYSTVPNLEVDIYLDERLLDTRVLEVPYSSEGLWVDLPVGAESGCHRVVLAYSGFSIHPEVAPHPIGAFFSVLRIVQ